MPVIIYTTSDEIWGGGQIYVTALCNFLNKSGIVASVYTSRPDMFQCRTVSISRVRSKWRRLLSASIIARQASKNGVKLVILDDLSSLWLAPVFRLFAIKVVSLLHLELRRDKERNVGHNLLEFHLLRLCSFAANRVLSVGTKNQTVLPCNVDFVGNFVPDWFFNQDAAISSEFNLGLISRFSSEKNLPLFLDLVSRLKEVAPHPIRVLMVGDGPELEWLTSEVSERKLNEVIQIQPWTQRAKLPEIYQKIGALVITSNHEGFPTTVLEAHAQGIPVISALSAGFAPSFILHEKPETGLVFEPQDLSSDTFLIRVLSLTARDEIMVKSCRQKARRFSESNVLGLIRDVIRSECPDL
jgi:glycosyltransferase involved in cell wall biosynthesis